MPENRPPKSPTPPPAGADDFEGANRVAPPGEELADDAALIDDEHAPRTAAFAELRDIYFRHRENLAQGEPAGIAEREIDRARVNEIYPDLVPGPEKMLDARTLGVLVDSQAATQRAALASLLSPTERLAMLAIVVRRNSFPVLTVSAQPTLSLAPLLSRPLRDAEADLADAGLDAASMADGKRHAIAEAIARLPETRGGVSVSAVDPRDIHAGRSRMLERAKRGLSPADIADLSEADAQFLSLLAGTRGVKLVSRPDGGVIAVDAGAGDREGNGMETGISGADADVSPLGGDAAHRPHSFVLNYRWSQKIETDSADG